MEEEREEPTTAVGAAAGPGPGAASRHVPEGEGVRNADELRRIEGSLGAVRAAVDRLKALGDRSLRERIAAPEQGRLAELEGILPEPLSVEQSDQ